MQKRLILLNFRIDFLLLADIRLAIAAPQVGRELVPWLVVSLLKP